MKNYYYKIFKSEGYRNSLKYLKFPQTQIDAMLERLQEEYGPSAIINQRGYFFVRYGYDGYGWNHDDCYFNWVNMLYMGELHLRGSKLKRLNEIAKQNEL